MFVAVRFYELQATSHKLPCLSASFGPLSFNPFQSALRNRTNLQSNQSKFRIPKSTQVRLKARPVNDHHPTQFFIVQLYGGDHRSDISGLAIEVNFHPNGLRGLGQAFERPDEFGCLAVGKEFSARPI